MKLIEHPHVLGLYNIYENKKYLLAFYIVFVLFYKSFIMIFFNNSL